MGAIALAVAAIGATEENSLGDRVNEHEERIARFRAMMDQARAAGEELSMAVGDFYDSLRARGLPESACEALTVEYLARLMGGNPANTMPTVSD